FVSGGCRTKLGAPFLAKPGETIPDGFTTGLANLDQAAVQRVPPDGEDEPLLDQETKQRGRELGFKAFRLPSARFIQFALILPKRKRGAREARAGVSRWQSGRWEPPPPGAWSS